MFLWVEEKRRANGLGLFKEVDLMIGLLPKKISKTWPTQMGNSRGAIRKQIIYFQFPTKLEERTPESSKKINRNNDRPIWN